MGPKRKKRVGAIMKAIVEFFFATRLNNGVQGVSVLVLVL